jgi:hypothetical protein
VRFCDRRADRNRLAEVLAAHRQTDFGTTEVTSLELVWCDWYASAGSARVLEEFELSVAG